MHTLALLLALHAGPPLPVSFLRDVAPILRTQCLKCHSGPKARGGLDLTSREAILKAGAAVPRKADESPLYTHVREGKMPPGKRLADHDAEALRRWIDTGIAWDGPALRPVAVATGERAGPDWWSLQPIAAKPPPPGSGQGRNPMDSFLGDKLSRSGLRFSEPADRRTLLRRLTHGLTGLRATPEEIEAFLADTRPDAYERQVERLLASPAYGERWARHWMDVARFAESHGYEMNTLRPNAWPYRDWLISALNRDISFGEFLREQLGDGDPAAAGFLVAGPHDLVGNATEEGKRQQRADDLHDIISTTTGAFLGLTAGCARCHDHKFDPVSQREYHALKAVFAGVTHGERALPSEGRDPPPSPRKNEEKFAAREARFLRFTIRATNDGTEPCLDEIEVYGEGPHNLAVASRGAKASASSEYLGDPKHRVAHLNDGQHGNGRSWISKSRGTGWAMIELPRPEVVHRVVWGRDREGKYSDRLAVEYSIETSLDGKAWAAAVSRKASGAARMVYAGVYRRPDEVRRLHLGDVMQPREVVGPGGIDAVAPPLTIPPGADDPARRRAFAEWVAHPKNPLTARVLANRVWAWHFGTGIVDTPSDFGFMGGKPSHPELLDWLAARLLETGSLKDLHRLIVTSRAYRQSSRFVEAAHKVDAANRLLWRFTPRRMEAEAVRDGMLQVAGTLRRQMGGPGYHLWDYSGYVIEFKPKARPGPESWRRMVYQFKPRLQQDGVFGAFDCPDATAAVPRRESSTTALQALNLMNDPFVLEQAEHFARRLREEAGPEVNRQVVRAFLLCFGRPPAPEEAEASEALARKHGLAALARALFNANEMVWVD
jgi:hypothetical protein